MALNLTNRRLDWSTSGTLLHLTRPPSASASQNKTVGIIGAGRIGTAYARMMVEGHKCDLVYYDPYPNQWLEDYVR